MTRNTFFAFFVLLACAATAPGQALKMAGPKVDITKVDLVMTSEEVAKFKNGIVNPILLNCAADPKSEPEPVQSWILKLVTDIKSGKLQYSTIGAYHPEREFRSAIKIEFSNGPMLLVFAPQLRDFYQELTAEQFRYEVLIDFSHEPFHLGQLGQYPLDTPEDIAIEEAAAWGKTVLKIIRPLQDAGRNLPPAHAKLSDLFRNLGDDYRNPEWIKLFRLPVTNKRF